MPTFDAVTGRHAQVPDDQNPAQRLALLRRKGLLEDRPVKALDDLAQAAAIEAQAADRGASRPPLFPTINPMNDAYQYAMEAADQVPSRPGFFAMVNLMKDGYQYFAGMWMPPLADSGPSQTTSTITPTDRFMDRSSGWCVHTVGRRKALPLNNVFDYPRWTNKAIHVFGFRTYLGAPLIDPPTGITLGTFALVGQETTTWSQQDVNMIKRYASDAANYIEALPDIPSPSLPH